MSTANPKTNHAIKLTAAEIANLCSIKQESQIMGEVSALQPEKI